VAVNRDKFWQRVEGIDSNEKLIALPPQELKDHERYFVEVQYDQDLPEWEKIAASNHLGRLQNEIDRRRSDYRHSRTQLIATVGIGVTALGIILGQCRYCTNRQPVSQPLSPSPLSTGPTPTATTTPQVTLMPTATAVSTPVPKAIAVSTPTPTATAQHGKKRRTRHKP
jgi:hypothetical protein